MRLLAQAGGSTAGEDFFRRLVRHLTDLLRVEGAWVTEYNAGLDALRALAFYRDGEYAASFVCAVTDGPWERAIRDGGLVRAEDQPASEAAFPSGFRAGERLTHLSLPLLAEDRVVIGHLGVFHAQPILEEPALSLVLEAFAGRAAGELRRRQLEERLHAREEQLSQLFDFAADPMVVTNARGVVQQANRAAARIFECSAEEIVGGPLGTLFSAASRPHVLRLFSFRPQEGASAVNFWSGILAARRREGSEFPLEVTLSRFESAGATGFQVVLRTIDERLAAEQRIDVLTAELNYLRAEAGQLMGPGELVGRSPAMRAVIETIERIAPSDHTVWIQGESGTGKELVARTLHHLSPACRQPFVRVGPAARSLEEHVALVNGGTLFLDDLGEWPLELQDQLLEALSAHEGESPEAEVNLQGARMIAAISGDLSALIEGGRLRETLSRRLAAFSIALPPLRARDGDIELLAQAFLERYSKRSGRWFAPLDADDAARLRGYRWPGNVRELQNVIERALLLSRGPRLDLARAMPSEATWESSPRVLSSSGRTEATILTALELRELERENLRRAVLACDGRIAGPSGAAAKLGLPPTTVASQVKALGLQRVRRARVSRTR